MELKWAEIREKLTKTQKGLFFMGLVFFLLGVVMVSVNAADMFKEAPESVEFAPQTESGVPAHAQIEYVELYAYTDSVKYYLCVDSELRFFIAKISAGDMKGALAALEDEPFSDTVYVEGMVRSLPSDVKAFLREDDWAGYDVNMTHYLDVGSGWYDNFLPLCIVMAAFSLMGVLLIFLARRSRFTLRRCQKNLEAKNLADEALRQFDTAEPMNNQVALADRFVYGIGSGIVLHIDDICWVFMRNRHQRYVGVLHELVILDKKREYILSTVKNDAETAVYNEIAAELMQRNPQILLGYTKENKAAYNALKRS